MNTEEWIILALIGLVAGWIANRALPSGMRMFGDLAIGVAGAVAGAWALPKLGFHPATGQLRFAIVATVGAFALLALARVVRRI